MAKKKPARRKKAASRKAGKGSGRRLVRAAFDDVEDTLKGVEAKLDDIDLRPGEEPDERAVRTMKGIAEEMQAATRGLRQALKHAMMADGKIKPGQVLTMRGRRVFLKPRPGCPDGSTNPDHYDLAYERIH